MKNKFDPLGPPGLPKSPTGIIGFDATPEASFQMNVESVSASISVLTRLKTETRPQHDAIEAALDLTSETLTLDAYLGTLERFHGFYRPLEAGLVKIGGWVERGLDLTERQKTRLLETDLRVLGVNNFEMLPVCTDLPPHVTVTAAFGCLYVLEGATLGGQVISQLLRNRLGVTPETGGRFFHAYGDRTGAMWQAFRAALTASVVKPCDEEEVVSAAKDTFLKLQHWLSAKAITDE